MCSLDPRPVASRTGHERACIDNAVPDSVLRFFPPPPHESVVYSTAPIVRKWWSMPVFAVLVDPSAVEFGQILAPPPRKRSQDITRFTRTLTKSIDAQSHGGGWVKDWAFVQAPYRAYHALHEVGFRGPTERSRWSYRPPPSQPRISRRWRLSGLWHKRLSGRLKVTP